LEVESGYLRVPSQTTAEVLSGKALYVYREIPLVITTQSDGQVGADVTSTAVVDTWICGGGPGKPAECEPVPWSFNWLKDHGINRKIASQTLVLKSDAAVKVPRIRGLTVAVRVSDWRPFVSRVEVSSTLDEARLPISLRAPNRVAGTIRFSDGTACAGARVRVYCEQRLNYDDLDYEPLQALGHGVACVGGPAAGARVTFAKSATSDADGRYTIDLNVDGAVLIEARTADGNVERTEIGLLSGTRTNADVTIQLRPKRTLSINANGVLLSKAEVLIADLSSNVGQPGWTSVLDDHGVLVTTGLVVGRRYFMRAVWKDGAAQREANGTLTWNDQESIDVQRDLLLDK
jgi:hypothetical protein